MRQRNEKKLFSFVNMGFINLALKDCSLLEGKNESTIAEEILLGRRPGLLPQSQTAANIVRLWYDQPNGCTQMYHHFFATLASLVTIGYTPERELLVIQALCTRLGVDGVALTDEVDQGRKEWFIKLFEQHIYYLDQCICTVEDEHSSEYRSLHAEIVYARELLRQLRSEPYFVLFHSLVNVIIGTWAYSRGSATTYRLLANLTQIITVRSTPETRTEFAEAVRNACTDWPR